MPLGELRGEGNGLTTGGVGDIEIEFDAFDTFNLFSILGTVRFIENFGVWTKESRPGLLVAGCRFGDGNR